MANNPLQSSGTISLNDINLELGKSSGSQIGLGAAETGGYVALRSTASPKPNGSYSSSLSEWYGYQHVSPGVSSIPMNVEIYIDDYVGGLRQQNIHFWVYDNTAAVFLMNYTSLAFNTNYIMSTTLQIGHQIVMGLQIVENYYNSWCYASLNPFQNGTMAYNESYNDLSPNNGEGHHEIHFQLGSASSGSTIELFVSGYIDSAM